MNSPDPQKAIAPLSEEQLDALEADIAHMVAGEFEVVGVPAKTVHRVVVELRASRARMNELFDRWQADGADAAMKWLMGEMRKDGAK